MAEKGWINIGRVVGDTRPKGDTGDTGALAIPGTQGLLVLVLLLKVRIILTRN